MWEQVGENKGIWTKYKNSKTGESSYKEHKPKTIWKGCKPEEHEWELTGNREATCKKCGQKRGFVLGKEILKKGKFISL